MEIPAERRFVNMKLKWNSYTISIQNFLIFIAFFLIYIGQCDAINQYSSMLTYAGLAIVLIISYVEFLRKKNRNRIIGNLSELLFLLILLSIGIMTQNIVYMKKIVLILSYFITVSVFVFGGYWLKDIKEMRIAVYGMGAALILGIILSLITNNNIFMLTSEGILKYGFTGGFGHKNSFSVSLLTIFAGFYLYYIGEKKSRKTCLLLFALCVLIFFTGSRTAWIMLFIMLASSNWKIINKVTPHTRFLLVTILIGGGILVSIIFVHTVVMNSTTFSHRFHGIMSYLNLYRDDISKLMLGNGEIVYRDNNNYFNNLWNLVGGNGSFEMGLFQIIVKNGLIGLLAYIYMLAKSIIYLKKTKNIYVQSMVLSMVLPFFISVFVEIYITQIIYPYTVFTWCIISCFNQWLAREKRYGGSKEKLNQGRLLQTHGKNIL